MTGLSGQSRRAVRQRRKRLFAALLCGASFFTGQMLFGGDGAALEVLPGAKQTGHSLQPAALTAVSETPVAEPDLPARQTLVRKASASSPSNQQTKVPAQPIESPAKAVAATGLKPADTVAEAAAEEEKLPPIVPAWAMPRPPRRTNPTASSSTSTSPAATVNNSSAKPSTALPDAPAAITKANPLRMDLGRAASPSPTTELRKTDRLASWPKLPAAKEDPAPPAVEITPFAKPLAAKPAWLSGPQPFAPATTNSASATEKAESPLASTAATSDIEARTSSRKTASQISASPPLEIRNPNIGRAVEVAASLPAEPVRTPTSNEPAEAAEMRAAAPETVVKAGATRDAEVRQADFGLKALGVQPAELAPPGTREEDFGVLPAGSPFEAIEQSGTVKLRVRRSVLLRTKVDVYRTAIVDEAVCDIVQFTPREVSIIGRSVGQTHVTFWLDDAGSAPITYLVEVLPDPQQIKADENKYELLQNVINEMFPDSKVYLVLVADKLVVKGQARDSEEAAQIMNIVRAQASGIGMGGNGGGMGMGMGIAQGMATPVLSAQATGNAQSPRYQVINMLRVPGVQQVALKVKIAELNRSAARGFGIDAKAAINFTDSAKTTQLFLASMLNASSTATNNGVTTGGTSVVTSFGGQEVNIGLRYLQERGVIRLLSEPTLVTLSGRAATFIAGGEFAVPTIVGSVGLNAVTTDFRAFGAIISFLPTVVDKDRIRLQVAPEFSQINSNLTSANNTPGLNVRAATTTVEMREGQTLAIAGLLEDSYKATTVGDLPGLAKIFGRRDTSRSETELIILVTPELVHPMEPEEVPPLPGFDVTEPTASQFFLHGEIEGNPTQDFRSTVWPRLKRRYGMGGPAMTSGPFGHGQ